MTSAIADEFRRFVEIVAELRHPERGCPWDLKQTHESLKPYLIEEAYEVLEAIERSDDSELCSELGDVLLQVVLHSQLATDRGGFSIADVTRTVCEKMVRRHPHVFNDTKVSGADEVVKNWEQIKSRERQESAASANTASPSALDGVPRALPALIRAQRLGEKAAKVRFDWENQGQVLAKVEEELAELRAELRTDKLSGDHVKEELGDFLFSITQLARWLGISAEDALQSAAAKFTNRFQLLERTAPRPVHELSAEELDALWQKVKGTDVKGTENF